MRNLGTGLITRLSGILTLLTAFAALIAGVRPLTPTTEVRDLRLALIGATAVCALLWAVLSVRAPLRVAVVLDKAQQPERLAGAILAIVFSIAVPMATAAALLQAVGPDSERGRWVSEVYAAGGATYEVPIDRVLGQSHETNRYLDDEAQYATDVAVTLRFDGGSRSVTVSDATTIGVPSQGRTISVAYAPRRPGLGVRNNDRVLEFKSFAGSTEVLFWIWFLVGLFGFMVSLISIGVAADALPGGADLVRRFRADIHGPTALILATGVCLLLPGAFFHAPSWACWILSVAAATTPWLALTWVLRKLSRSTFSGVLAPDPGTGGSSALGRVGPA